MAKALIIGYGSQGRPQALNLKDGGFDVCVYLPDTSKRLKTLENDKIRHVSNLDNELTIADYIVLLIPDSSQPGFYKKYLHGKMKAGSNLVFAHGYNIHYKKIDPQKNINVILVAPSAHGDFVRSSYKDGFACFVATLNNSIIDSAKAYAKAIGGNPIIKTTFKEETEIDLFTEQAVLCGGLHAIIKTAFDTLIANGYSKEIAYFSCLKEVLPLAKLIHNKGLNGMYENISDTAAFGSWLQSKNISENIEPVFNKILIDIKNGSFANEMEKTSMKIPPEEFAASEINKSHTKFSKEEK